MNTMSWKAFVPIDYIEKAVDSEGKEVLKIGGIASTADRDDDGEILDPDGFDTKDLMKYGFFNWHHQAKKDAGAIVGEPTKVETRGNKFYVEGFLYPELELARNIYNLMKVLNERKSSRKLGFSLEGVPLEYKPGDTTHIKRAKLTNIAITPTPKNHFTVADIVKGRFDKEKQEKFDLEEFLDQTDPNGGTIYIIDITTPEGNRILVDKGYNVKIIQKSIGIDEGRALIREDVEGGVKPISNFSKKKKKDVDEAVVTLVKGFELGVISKREFARIRSALEVG